MDGELVEDVFPAVDSSGRVGPVLAPFDRDQIEDFQRRLIGREMSAAHCGFPEPGVQRFDRVRGVHDLAKLGWELEERDEVLPRVSPRLDHRRILGFPVFGELFERFLGRR